jgi:hypothetical protein
MGDLLIVLSIIASVVALWFQFSSARAGKRALALIRSDPRPRDPGVTLEVIGVTPSADRMDVEVRVTNPAGAGNVLTAWFLNVEYRGAKPVAVTAEQKDGPVKAPFAIGAGEVMTGHVSFRVREGIERAVVVLLDLDGRRATVDLTAWR